MNDTTLFEHVCMKVQELKFHIKEISNIFHRDFKKSLDWVEIEGTEEMIEKHICITFVLGDGVQMASFVGQFQTLRNL